MSGKFCVVALPIILSDVSDFQCTCSNNMAKRLISLSKSWLDAEINPQFASWIAAVPGHVGIARCRICSTDFHLSNMGCQAVASHMNSKKCVWHSFG
jgi:hypothetical protein